MTIKQGLEHIRSEVPFMAIKYNDDGQSITTMAIGCKAMVTGKLPYPYDRELPFVIVGKVVTQVMEDFPVVLDYVHSEVLPRLRKRATEEISEQVIEKIVEELNEFLREGENA